MAVDLTQSPYLIKTEEEKAKGYYQILAVPGRYIQARELSQLQHLVQLQLRDLANILFKEGAIVEGCQIVIEGNTVTITSGSVYYNGFIVPVAETVLGITGTGTEIIGVDITEEIVTEEEDPDLRDIYPGGRGYGKPGAHRLKITTQVVLSPTPTIKLYELKDGALVQHRQATEYSTILNILARRTYDESENYLVRGLTTSALLREDGKADLITAPGKAYVLGYEVSIPSPVINTVNPCTSTRSITDEMHLYQSGTTDYALYKQPVASVNVVRANVQVTDYNMVRGATIGGADTIPFNNVLQVIEVKQDTTTYTAGTDYNIVNGNIIDWSPLGAEPNPGTSYTVTFIYQKILVPGEGNDYQVTTDTKGDTIIKFLPTVDNIVDGSYFEVDYDYYLARTDVLYLDKDGNITRLEGEPADVGFNKKPIPPSTSLPLCEIYFPPNSNQLEVTNYNLKRISMPELHELIRRVEMLEYNLALSQLDDPVNLGSSPTDLVGMFSEGCVGYTKADIYHPNWNGAIVPELQAFVPGYSEVNHVALPVASSTAQKTQNAYILPYEETIYIEQPKASSSIRVNQYALFEREPFLSTDPSEKIYNSDVIINESTETVVINTKYARYDRFHPRNSVSDRIISSWFENRLLRQESLELIPEDTTITIRGSNFYPDQDNLKVYVDGVNLVATPIEGTPLGTDVGTVKSKSDGTFALTVTLPANKFTTGLKKIEVKNDYQSAETYFYANGVRDVYERVKINQVERTIYNQSAPNYTPPPCPIPRPSQNCAISQPTNQPTSTPKPSSSSSSSSASTVVGAATGAAIGAMVAGPIGALLGAIFGGFLGSAANKKTCNNGKDPVAQTFYVGDTCFITSVGLYFKKKDSNNIPVTVQIRNVVNGYPGEDIIASKTVTPDQINVSDDSSAETVITFDSPILLLGENYYCITISSDSTAYEVFYAEMGQSDLLTGAPISRQPYLQGLMFSSSNALAWADHQTWDIKFKIYRAQFTASSATIVTETVNYNYLQVLPQLTTYIPENTKIKLYYSFDNGATWYPLANNLVNDTPKVQATSIKLKLEMESNTDRLSPVVADKLLISLYQLDTSATYVSRTIISNGEFTNIELWCDVYRPSATNCSATVSISTDNGQNWTELTNMTLVGSPAYNWERRKYTHTLGSPATSLKVRVDLNTLQVTDQPACTNLIVLLR
jgi:hypothetical protein